MLKKHQQSANDQKDSTELLLSHAFLDRQLFLPLSLEDSGVVMKSQHQFQLKKLKQIARSTELGNVPLKDDSKL